MPATEELRVYLRTVADTAGAAQTQQAIKGVATTAASASRSVTADLQTFAVGYLTVTKAAELATNAVSSSINAQRDHERIVRATTASYGNQTVQFTKFASALEAQTGFTSDAILEAALSARTLSQNYGLTIQQTQNLIRASADLARIRGIGIAEAFERVQSAIRGEAEASEYLGLTLNDTFVKNNAMNGSLKNTFETMTDQQKAQIRYNELLKQTEAFSGLAAKGTDSLDGAFGRAEVSGRKLQRTLGEVTKPATVTGLNEAAKAADLLARALERGARVDPIGIANALGAAAVDRALEERRAAANAERKRVQETELKRLREINDIGPRAGEAEAERVRVATERTRTEQQLRRLREINELPVRDTAAELARLAFLDQVDAAVREITNAQQNQLDLQRQATDLAAQEASIRLSMLPTQQALAAAQRDATEAQIRARQAALPATEALEDLRFEQERARLIASNRQASGEERAAARQALRGLGRAEPGIALAALQAGRGVTLAGRAAERVGMEAQLFAITQERALAQVTLAQETNKLLSQIAEQRTQSILLTINLSSETFSQEVYKELIEASAQAPVPPTIQLSGVRRGPS
jgi:hypothetical protein